MGVWVESHMGKQRINIRECKTKLAQDLLQKKIKRKCCTAHQKYYISIRKAVVEVVLLPADGG